MVSEYISYFRSLAIDHTDIAHNPLSETDAAGASEKHFTRIAIEEVIGGLRSAVGFPCLALEIYETEIHSENPISLKSITQGAFMVIDHPATDSFADEQAVYEKTERIVFELLQKIWQDHYSSAAQMCDRPFSFFDFDKMTITPVGPLFTGEHGYRVTFSFELQKTVDITKPPAAGVFNI